MKLKKYLISAILLMSVATFQAKEAKAPCIVNIINFVRGVEPRDNGVITTDILYNTVVEQAKELRKCDLTGTYLLMYNALTEPRYQQLMKEEIARGCEVGGWWEICEPQCLDANVLWRASVPWLHYAYVGFSMGYDRQERIRLVDTYMAKFKEIFGTYPASIGSWFIDSYTLGYLYDKYGIEASCICRDQVGTDGYTMWGGYWTGGYYPSRKNTYMPAQTAEQQIDVPVFRMLGSDPIYQYDAGLGINAWQSVRTLEPTCTDGGGDSKWVDWYFGTLSKDPSLGFTYAQMGQENSFTWARFGNAFCMQAEKLKELKSKNAIRIENLVETGRWFKKNYPSTPATAETAMSDYTDNNNRTVWFNSKNYRANIIWEGYKMKIRDIHLFDERCTSLYFDKPCRTSAYQYITLPVVDGNLWSTAECLACMRIYDKKSGKELLGGQPKIETKGEKLLISWPLNDQLGEMNLTLSETEFLFIGPKNLDWYVKLYGEPNADLPFETISPKEVAASQDGFHYGFGLKKGIFADLRGQKNGDILSITPEGNKISIQFGK